MIVLRNRDYIILEAYVGGTVCESPSVYMKLLNTQTEAVVDRFIEDYDDVSAIYNDAMERMDKGGPERPFTNYLADAIAEADHRIECIDYPEE